MPGGRKKLIDFLADVVARNPDVVINFTGHSLGGLAAPTLALFAREQLGDGPTIRVFSFAGPTAGNESFARYSDKCLNTSDGKNDCLCFRNALDFAASAWNADALKATGDTYEEEKRLLLPDFLTDAFYKELTQLGFERLETAAPIPSAFCKLRLGAAEVGWQHIWPYPAALLGRREALRLVKDTTLSLIGLRARFKLGHAMGTGPIRRKHSSHESLL